MIGNKRYQTTIGSNSKVIWDTKFPGQVVSEYIPCELSLLLMSTEIKSIILFEFG